MAIAVAAVALTSGGDDSEESGAPTEIFLEPVGTVGEDPFGDDVSEPVPDPTIPPSTTAPAGGTAAGVTTVQGTAPGLYGGTENQSVCDAAAMVDYLEANPDKAAAWAGAVGIDPGQIRNYVRGLTPVLLEVDTRVTNHGFKDGKATPKQSVLQAGTAVLVDNTGVPRARCACGNPLDDPQAAPQNFTGDQWSGFDPEAVQAVSAGPPASSFTVRDVRTGQPFQLPVGSAVPAGPSTPSTTTSTTTGQAAGQNVAGDGTIQVSSTYSAEFVSELAIDGDKTTSWFSDGAAGGDEELYVWTPIDQAARVINRVVVVGNGDHPQFPTNFGFNAVTVKVLAADGTTAFEQRFELPGTPDPTITVEPGVTGARVALLFEGHESADCGGFAELEIYAA